jgi:hypothetical protein
MKRINALLLIILFSLVLSSCGNDGVYNEETNREDVKGIKDLKRKAEKVMEDSISLQIDFSYGVAETGWYFIVRSISFIHLLP